MRNGLDGSEAREDARLRLVAGLGNPGPRYEGTRHNVGFHVVRELAVRRQARVEQLECNALVAKLDGLLLVLPQTYMNRSGFALRCLAERYGFEPQDVLVVYDEIHLPLGRLRLRKTGSPAGHRGMESVLENLRTSEVPRLRCGIGPEEVPGEVAEVPGQVTVPGEELVEHVLSPFTAEEESRVREMVQRAADACDAWLELGAEAAMNRFNR